MNIYSGLLFLHGHIADAGLARALAEPVKVPEGDAARAVTGAATQGVALPVRSACGVGTARR
ncbi:hypothetical protein [Stenotrophomonas sp. PS02300]|jgi:hypothetical protein|uniref:hypothetical protein n=1 Tax=Stenotrophomonas sp. PS02300 TaxID=2991426 RepID=UPI00249A24DC|nr:hypothetical protein [Stenotrophomonas sp. PS02300]